MTADELELLRKRLTQLRISIDRAKDEYRGPNSLTFVEHWPSNCCDAPHVYFLLYHWGYRGMQTMTANVPQYGNKFCKHNWIELDGVIIDLTADQFPDVADKVIVTRNSPWHAQYPRAYRDDTVSDEDWYATFCSERWRSFQEVVFEILPQYQPPLDEC